MYEIIGESIKSAISIRLGTIFNNPIRYKENVTNQNYPNFHIIQVSCNVTPAQTFTSKLKNENLERIQLDYLMNIQYRVAENQETVSNLRQQLDATGLKLLAEFKYINLDKQVFAKNSRYEIVDGVLQYFCNFTIYATLEPQNDALQRKLEIDETIMQNLNIKEDD